MLELDEDGIVFISKDVENCPEVIALKKKCKTKEEFLKYITYAYHQYRKNHVLSSFGPHERAIRVSNMYFSGNDVDAFESVEEFKNFKNLYLDIQHTATSRFIENLKKDMEDTLEHIQNIPLTRKELVEITIPDNLREVKTKRLLDVDNSKEKFAALSRAEDLLKLYDRLNEKLRNELRDEKKKGGVRRIFDKRTKE